MHSPCSVTFMAHPCDYRFRPGMQMQECMHEHAISSGRHVRMQERRRCNNVVWRPSLVWPLQFAPFESRYCREAHHVLLLAGAAPFMIHTEPRRLY
jgi:hypothetical protein